MSSFEHDFEEGGSELDYRLKMAGWVYITGMDSRMGDIRSNDWRLVIVFLGNQVSLPPHSMQCMQSCIPRQYETDAKRAQRGCSR